MAAKEPFEIPVGMRRVCQGLERWRKGHQARLPTRQPTRRGAPLTKLTEVWVDFHTDICNYYQ